MQKSREYVYEVYLEKSFSKAAEKLFISKPALSATIKKVEDELGVELFDRRVSPICLTKAGECYIRATEEIMEIEKKMLQELSALSESSRCTINVGGASFFCAHILPSIIESFKQKYPGYTVNVLEGNAKDISKYLQTGDMDLSIDVESLDENVFDCVIWQEEHIVLAVPANYKVNEELSAYGLTFEDISTGRYLGNEYPSVSMSHFRNESFLMLKRGNDMFRRGMKICKNSGFAPKVLMYLDQMLTSYYVACDGKGVAFVRGSLTHYVEPTEKVVFYKIDNKDAVRSVMLHWKKNAVLSPAVQKFVSFLGQVSDLQQIP